MEIEKLIERLNGLYTALREEGEQKCSPERNTVAFVLMDAATSLSTLQAENEKLRAEVERQRRSADNGQHLYENAERAYMKVLAELEQVKQERDVAIKEIFQWTGCPACKHWDSADNWCNKHDRSADSCDGCSTPEWHGLEKA